MIIIKKDKFYIVKCKNRKFYLKPLYYRGKSLKNCNNISLKRKCKLPLKFPYILTTDNLALPPRFIPKNPTFAVDPGAISGCLYRYTYIWPRNGRPYWFYPTFVGRRSVAGYRWTGSFWVYAGVDVNQIREFQCV